MLHYEYRQSHQAVPEEKQSLAIVSVYQVFIFSLIVMEHAVFIVLLLAMLCITFVAHLEK